MKQTIKSILPSFLIELRQAILRSIADRRWKGKQPKQVFNEVYREGLWGRGTAKYYSGPGSHAPEVVGPYVSAIREFSLQFDTPKSALDIGCGDFEVGSQVRSFFSSYIACDVSDEVIAQNRERYGGEFKCIDATSEALPHAEVVILREVLQHLSNQHIIQVLSNVLSMSPRFLIVTNTFYTGHDFKPNVDIATGAYARRRERKSGVVLTEPPFNLKPESEKSLCMIPFSKDAAYLTILYKLY